MSYIEELRALGDFDGTSSDYSDRDEKLDEIEDLIYYNPMFSKKPFTVEVVDEKFEDLGRWSNYETKVFKIIENDVVAYFEYGTETPATESQDGMDCSYHFQEVLPVPVTKFKYVPRN